MKTLSILFWLFAAVVFYTYAGYGILVWILVRIKERFAKKTVPQTSEEYPEVTLLIAAYNEQDVVDWKMLNCRALRYPADRLHITWVTDGSNDRTVELLSAYDDVTVIHEDARKGKTAALNHAMRHIATPIVVMTDANTRLNEDAVIDIVRKFDDPQVGCVAGEKRVAGVGRNAADTEGIYWKYESFLKEMDDRLYSTQGAAGELFAIRRKLWEEMPEDTLLDDMMCSMSIAAQGYRIAYCKEATSTETPSANVVEEGKRKIRISAGGFQLTWRLRRLLNPFRYGVLTFQFFSHRVLRWIVSPSLLVLLIVINAMMVLLGVGSFYTAAMVCQIIFYSCAYAGWKADRSGRTIKAFSVPYYFVFMNFSTFMGLKYFIKGTKGGAWVKAQRA